MQLMLGAAGGLSSGRPPGLIVGTIVGPI